MLIKTEEIKNEAEPTSDFPLNNGEPNLIPIIAAKQSPTMSINQETMTNPLLNNTQLSKKPSAM